MNIRRNMTLTYLEEKLMKKVCYGFTIVIVFITCSVIHSNCINVVVFDKEYWRFQNNSFKILLKKNYNRNSLYVINYILEGNSNRDDIQTFVYFIILIIVKLHNNLKYVKNIKYPKFLEYKINYSELYDFLLYNIIFNFWITFPIVAVSIELWYSMVPYIPVYSFVSIKIFLDTMEKLFKILLFKYNKIEWKIFTK